MTDGQRRMGRHIAAAVIAGSIIAMSVSASASGGPACRGTHWVTAWEAPPTDAAWAIDSSYDIPRSGPHQTFRVILSPDGQGSTIRLRFSNRFGKEPVTLDDVRIARPLKQASGSAAIVPGSSLPVLFHHLSRTTLLPGEDKLSDPLQFEVAGLEDVAVSMSVPDPGRVPTHHSLARQHCFATKPRAGDHTADTQADAFTESFTSRPFVTGLEVEAPAAASTVVTLGDSLTDGFQALPGGYLFEEDPGTLDLNERYPDYLYRRLQASGLPLFVANAGISGNRVLHNGLIPPLGPSALSRLAPDVLAQDGVSDVILWEGINDIGLTPGLTAQQLEDGYSALIAELHAYGLHVIQATLTPSEGATIFTYSDHHAMVLRNEVNDWIRHRSPADAVADFDAAMRDPADPDKINPLYDDGDGLHFTAAGYEQIANTLDLSRIRGNGCH